jgi:hypothetical protein
MKNKEKKIKRVNVDVTIRLSIDVLGNSSTEEIEDIINDLDYNFEANEDEAIIVDTEMTSFEINDDD